MSTSQLPARTLATDQQVRKTGRRQQPRPQPLRLSGTQPHLRVLHFLRHGAHDDSIDEHHPGGGLTGLGKEQCKHAARYLETLPIEVIHTSDLRRATETADVVASTMSGVPVRRTKLLREDMLTAPPGQRWKQQKRLAAKMHFEKLWMKYFRPARRRTVHELLVTHGNLTRCLVAMVLNCRPVSSWARILTYNCSLTTFLVDGDANVDVSTVNNVGYLPPALVTQSSGEGSVYTSSE